MRVCGGFRGILGNRINLWVLFPVGWNEDIALHHEETKPSLLWIKQKMSDLVWARFLIPRKRKSEASNNVDGDDE